MRLCKRLHGLGNINERKKVLKLTLMEEIQYGTC